MIYPRSDRDMSPLETLLFLIRAGRETPLRPIKLKRELLEGLDGSFYRTRFKVRGQSLIWPYWLLIVTCR